MSFSATVKEELAEHVGTARHCQLAELAAIIEFCGKVSQNGKHLLFETENETIERKCFTLLKKTFNIEAVTQEEGRLITDSDAEEKLAKALFLTGTEEGTMETGKPVNALLIKNSCCARAYLRGAFLCIGSMSDPEKSYHLEFVCEQEKQAQQIQQTIAHFDLEAKIICRKKHYVVYMKEGAAIVDLLNVMGARLSLMYLENLRVEKEVRNSVNRKVNCEAANITKTVNAASKQIEDIQYLQKHYGMEKLPENLREMAEIRLEYPESSLQELGKFLNPPVGKSGVNHRLRKLSELADKIRV